MACVKSVQRSTITLAAGTTVATASPAPAGGTDLTHSVTFFTKRPTTGADVDFSDQAVEVFIDGTDVKGRTSSAVTRVMVIDVTLVEFDSDRTNVYKNTFSTTGTTATASVTDIDQTKSFLFFSYISSHTVDQTCYHRVRGKFTSDTALEFSRITAGGTISGNWAVVESTAGDFSVEAKDITLADNIYSNTATITGDGQSGTKTWLIGSVNSANADTGNRVDQWGVHAELTNATTITVMRAIDSSKDYEQLFTIYAVRMLDGTTVEHGVHTETDDTVPQNITLASSVPSASAWAHAPVDAAFTVGSRIASINTGCANIQWGMTFSGGPPFTTLVLTRGVGTTGSTERLAWEVVNFDLVEAEPPSRRIFIIS